MSERSVRQLSASFPLAIVAAAAATIVVAAAAPTLVGSAHCIPMTGASDRCESRAARAPADTAQLATLPDAHSIVALRGYSAVAPENTIAALGAAEEAGALSSWVDVRTSSDGVLLLIHDETLDRTTDCTGRADEQTVARIQGCDAGGWFDSSFAGERVPTLAETLDRGGSRLVVRMLDATAESVTLDVSEASAQERVTLVASSTAQVKVLQSALPSTEVMLWAEQLGASAVELAVDSGADGVAVPARGLRVDQVETATSAGLAVMAEGLSTETGLFLLAEMGVDGLVTHRVEPALQAVGYQYRTYGQASFDRTNTASQGFVGPLTVGDFNSDSWDDLVVTAPLDSATVPSGGWLAATIGGTAFPGRRVPLAPSQLYPDGQWGSVAAIGDYNGDSFGDLAVGYEGSGVAGPGSGAIWLMDGSSTGVGDVSRPIGPPTAPGTRMGAALAAGDFNADGIDDLAVGIPGARVGAEGSAGSVILMPGLLGSGPVTGGSLTVDRSSEDVPGEPASQEQLGTALVSGDFNGDGMDDVAIGIPSAAAGGVRQAGSVLVVYVGTDLENGELAALAIDEISRADVSIPGEPERLAEFGSVLAAADFDADGFDDLVIGAPGSTVASARSAGEIVLRYGGSEGLDEARTEAINQNTPIIPGEAEARDRFGAALAVGDLDGDGRPDLAVGTPDEASGSRTRVGQVVVVYAGEIGLRPRAALEIAPGMLPVGLSRANRQAFGGSLAIGKLNRDDAADLAIGVPGQSIGGVPEAGALTVAWGYDEERPGVPTATPRPPTRTPQPTITLTPQPTYTPRPLNYIFLPYGARLATHDRWPTPAR